MLDIYDYETLLKRAREKVSTIPKAQDRFKIPEPELIAEGRMTIFRNFMELAKILDRNPTHLAKFLLRELGTAGGVQGERMIFKSRVSPITIKLKTDEYIKTYVRCNECGSPDTILRKEGRTEILVCKACGAIRPVVSKIDIRVPQEKLIEGREYELEITDLSRDGYGIVRKGQYIVYVPGSKKGQRVKVKIEKIKKNIVFATIVK